MKQSIIIGLITLTFVGIGFQQPERVDAQGIITVDSLVDAPVDLVNPPVTLRDAIAEANANPLASTIEFAVSGTIVLQSPAAVGSNTNRYLVNTPIVINGNNQITIDGGDATQLFYINGAGALTLNDIVVTNGFADAAETWAGGGIHLDAGSLVMNNSTLSNNTASGENGGLYIASGAVVTINNSTISGNVSGTGASDNAGGILNFGTLTITNSTLSGNSAPNATGGAIFNTGTLTMTHTTIANNTAFSTGGVFSGGSSVTNLAGTIFSNNGRNCSAFGGWVDNGYNISDDGFCFLTQPTSLASTPVILGGLAANGGPTLTHLPGASSPAINLIPTGTLVTNAAISYTCNQTLEILDSDQRGEPRPVAPGGACDSGSVEAGDAAAVIVSAISNNTTEAGGTATFTVRLSAPPSVGNVTIPLTSSNTDEGTVTGSVVLDGTNWATGVTVTVTGVDDDFDDGNIAYTIITGAPSSTSPEYSALTAAQVADVAVINDDDDVAGVSVGAISNNTSETAPGTATFLVTLDSEPTGGTSVTVALSSDDTTEGTVPASVTIPAGSWDTGVLVTVTGVDDDFDDGNVPYNIVTGNVTSGPAEYAGILGAAIDDVAVINDDNDTAGVSVGLISGNTSETAPGTATFQVTLDSEPIGGTSVTVALSSDDTTEGTVPASVTIPAGSWDTGVTVTVTGVDDDLVDGDIAYNIVTGDVTSGPAEYVGILGAAIDDVSVTNDDDDVAGVSVGAISGNTSEPNVTATFLVTLDTQPTVSADVTVALSSSDTTEGTVPANVVIPAAQWDTGVTVTVTGVDDDLVDGNVAYTIVTGDVTSTVPEYSGMLGTTIADVAVTNLDDDVAGVTVGAISGNTTEAGFGTATFLVTLDTRPTGDNSVTVALSSSDTTEGTVPANVTIPAASWDTGVTVTVTGVDDLEDDGNIAYTIVTGDVTSLAAEYDALVGADVADVAVTNVDDDTAGINVSAISGNTTEAGLGTATFTITLDTPPVGGVAVTIPLTSSDTTEGTVPASVTILASEWDTGVTVTVTGVDDLEDDGNIAYTIQTGDPFSGAPEYDGLGAGDVDDVAVTNVDDDTAGITVSAISGNTTETGPGTATFTIALTSQPTGGADVTIPLSSSDTTEGTVPVNVIIPNASWQAGVTVTVTGVDDALVDGDITYTIVTGDPTSAALEYNAFGAGDVADVSVTNEDNDTAGITIGSISGNTSETAPGTATFLVTLTSQPTLGADVVIPLSSSDTTEGTVPANVTIPNASWLTGVTVTVTGVDDTFVDGDIAYTIVTGDPTSAALEYNAFGAGDVADVSVTNLDNDVAGVTVSAISGNTTEAGPGAATFTVALTSQPNGNADVTIPLSSSDTTEGTVPANVTIPNASWQTGVTVTVTGVDDLMDDGDIAYTIITGDPTSGAAEYEALGAGDVADVAVTNVDNDTAGINVSPISGNTTEAGPGTATFTITLASEPVGGADVLIPLSSSDPTEGTVPASVNIPNPNWQTGVTVTVTGVDDAVDDGDIAYTIITGDPTSAAAEYDAFGAADVGDVAVTNVDDDTAGVTVSLISGDTTEDLGTATFTVALLSQPAGGADVAVALSSSDPTEGTVPASVTIPNANWQTGATVTVTGVDDLLIDGNVGYLILTGDVTSADGVYDAFGAGDVGDVAVLNIDNDAPLVANPDTYGTDEDVTLTVDAATGVLLNDSGGNGNPLSAVLDTNPGQGNLTYFNADGSFEYVPNLDFYGVDTFTYHATDGTNDSAVVTVTINVAIDNTNAVAKDDYAEGANVTTIVIDVLKNDSDPDGDPLSIASVSQPSVGQVEIKDGKLYYTPVAGFTGLVSFTYTVDDGWGGYHTATVMVAVYSPVPLCSDFDNTTNEIIRANVPGGTITSGSVFCRVLTENSIFVRESAEVGKPEVLSRGVIQAVDVFALYHDGTPTAVFNNPIDVCLQGSGAFLYLDATVAPRSVVELPVFTMNGYSCATVPNAGTVVLVSGSPSAVGGAPVVIGPSTPLTNCMVTTRDMLNLRVMPSASSDVVDVVPYDVKLTALESSGAWYYVDYLGARGWVNAGYVTPSNGCSQ